MDKEIKTEADNYANRIVALGWRENPVKEDISGDWEAGYVFGFMDGSKTTPPSLREQPLREALTNVTNELANMIECWDTDSFTDREWDDARKAVEAARTALEGDGCVPAEGNFLTDAEIEKIASDAWDAGMRYGVADERSSWGTKMPTNKTEYLKSIKHDT